jgi:GntP family gluconate:H+ symporter
MLVPPTPGPLAMAAELNVDLGIAILVGATLALPSSLFAGVVYGRFLHSREDFPLREAMGATAESLREKAEADLSELPGPFESLLPILLPVVLIASNTIATTLYDGGAVVSATTFLGDPNFALTAAALVSSYTFYRLEMDGDVDLFNTELTEAIKSGGNIIAITAAGGTFGAMLATAGVGEYIAGGLEDIGLGLLVTGWLIAAIIRVAQGSGTVAILTGASIMAPLAGGLSVNPVYLMMAVGFGGMIAPWFNDSGFWIIKETTGITSAETFKTYGAVATIMSTTGIVLVLIMSTLLPLV